jgi:hypothetical protein
MQKKATPIREGVVNLKDTSKETMEDLKTLSTKLEDRFGCKCFQIHIHADEGHYKNKEKQEDWKPNYHAHMVFDWTHKDTGKGLRLKPEDMIEMQNIVAETLDMTRGKSSDKKHLHHVQFKNEKEKEKELALKVSIDKLEKEIKKIELNKDDYTVNKSYLFGMIKTKIVDKEKTNKNYSNVVEAQRRKLEKEKSKMLEFKARLEGEEKKVDALEKNLQAEKIKNGAKENIKKLFPERENTQTKTDEKDKNQDNEPTRER